MNRIAIIGNGGGGKTTLSRRLKDLYSLPLTHVDSIQYLTGMKNRAETETRKVLNDLADQEQWIIDGFGPMDVMVSRFLKADRVVFVDLPIWRHYWWCTKRQIKSLWSPRTELPDNCNEATFSHTFQLFNILWRVHSQIRPKLIELFNKSAMTNKVITVKTISDWNKIFKEGIT